MAEDSDFPSLPIPISTLNSQLTVTFLGTGKLSGAGGTIIFKVKPGTSGCGDDAGQLFSISGKATVLKATGKLAKRHGTLKMTGLYNRDSGAFTIKFTGALTV